MNPETLEDTQPKEVVEQPVARTWESSEWFRRWLELIRGSNQARA